MAGVGEGDILAHRAVEKHVLLQDDADLAAQPRRIRHREIHAVDQHAAAFRQVETLHQLGEGALARARRSDDTDGLPGGNVEGDVVQDLRSFEPVAE